MNSLPNQEVELAYSQVRWNKVFFLVQVSYSGFGGLLYNNLEL